MTAKSPNGPIRQIVDFFPDEVSQDSKIRARLRKLGDYLDRLTAVDAAGNLFVDQDVASEISNDADIIPPDLKDKLYSELKAHLGDSMKVRGSDRAITWREVGNYQDVSSPLSGVALRQLGIDKSTSAAQARQILLAYEPDLPTFFLDSDAHQIGDVTLHALGHNRTVWDCVVAHKGFWAAVAIFAAAGALLIVGTATGPWGIPLAIYLIGLFGGATATVVYRCVQNPDSNF